MTTTLASVRLPASAPAHYSARLARDLEDLRGAQSLRFQVFNLELHEGLEQSHASGLDQDPFDAVCDHLIVEHVPSANVVGTYRLQTGATAAANLGFTPRMVRDRGLIQTRAQERFYVDLLSAAEALRRQGKCLDVPNWTI